MFFVFAVASVLSPAAGRPARLDMRFQLMLLCDVLPYTLYSVVILRCPVSRVRGLWRGGRARRRALFVATVAGSAQPALPTSGTTISTGT